MSTRRLAGKLPNTMRRDPGDTHKTFFGFVDLPARGEPPLVAPEIAYYPGQRGKAERALMIEKGERCHISLIGGWITDKLSFDHDQAIRVRDALNRMYPVD